jgi:hypothetical protein
VTRFFTVSCSFFFEDESESIDKRIKLQTQINHKMVHTDIQHNQWKFLKKSTKEPMSKLEGRDNALSFHSN